MQGRYRAVLLLPHEDRLREAGQSKENLNDQIEEA